MPKLNIKRETFCLEYSKTGNATQSAIAAGYSIKTARSQGQRLLTKVDIQNRLQEIAEEIESEKIANTTEIQQFLTSVMRNETKEDVVVVEGDGDGYSSAAIVEKSTFLKDRVKAAETLAKMQGAFSSNLSVNLSIPIINGDEELGD